MGEDGRWVQLRTTFIHELGTVKPITLHVNQTINLKKNKAIHGSILSLKTEEASFVVVVVVVEFLVPNSALGTEKQKTLTGENSAECMVREERQG